MNSLFHNQDTFPNPACRVGRGFAKQQAASRGLQIPPIPGSPEFVPLVGEREIRQLPDDGGGQIALQEKDWQSRWF